MDRPGGERIPLLPVDPFHGNADAAAHGGATYSGGRRPKASDKETANRPTFGDRRATSRESCRAGRSPGLATKN